MKRFIEGQLREQAVLFPEHLDDWIAEDNPVRAVDAFIEELNLQKLGFESAEPAPTLVDKQLRIVVLSGYLTDENRPRALAAGADVWVAFGHQIKLGAA